MRERWAELKAHAEQFMIEPPVRISAAFQWQLLGRVRIDDSGRLLFPVAPRRPGLYRFRLHVGEETRYYIGETDNLRRRLQHYRTPGPTQKTNIRLSTELQGHIAAGGSIEVDIVADRIELTVSGTPSRADMADRAVRRLLEQAALIAEAEVGADLLNR